MQSTHLRDSDKQGHNSGSKLRELEDFGLLNRVHVQGGYDYEIFDDIQVHSVENRLNGKSIEQKSKIHSMENRLNISNKESLVNEEERELIIDIVSSCDPVISEFEFDAFLDSCIFSAKNIKNVLAYRVAVGDALINEGHKNHKKTLMAYQMFKVGYAQNKNILPDGMNIFDLIGRA